MYEAGNLFQLLGEGELVDLLETLTEVALLVAFDISLL